MLLAGSPKKPTAVGSFIPASAELFLGLTTKDNRNKMASKPARKAAMTPVCFKKLRMVCPP